MPDSKDVLRASVLHPDRSISLGERFRPDEAEHALKQAADPVSIKIIVRPGQ